MRKVYFHNILFLFCSIEKAKESELKRIKIHTIFFQEFGSLGWQSNSNSGLLTLRKDKGLQQPVGASGAVGLKLSVLQEQQQDCIPAHSKGIHSTKSAWTVLINTGSTALCFSMTHSGTGWAEPQPMSGSLVVFSVWAGNAFSAGQLRHVY